MSSSTGVRKETDTNSRIIRGLVENDKAFVQSMKVFGNLRGVGGGGGSARNSIIGPIRKIQNLGTLPTPFDVNFAIHDERQLYGNIDKNTTINFVTPLPSQLNLSMRLFIDSADPTITIGGTNLKTAFPAIHPLTANDFLDIIIHRLTATTVEIISVKKNDETGDGPVAPSVPGNLETFNHQKNQISLRWEIPTTGNLPITYELAYSLDSGGTPQNGPTNPEANPPAETSELNATFTGLNPGVTYYLWVRAKNSVGNSNWNGPQQTNTEPSDTAGDVGFAIAAKAGTFDTITAQWTQPAGKDLSFDLLRKLTTDTIFKPVVDDDNPAPTVQTIFDDTGLKQNTAYNYRFIVKNEFGSILATINTTVTTNQIDAPVVVLANEGARLKFTVTIPDGIDLAEVEWSLSNTVDANGNFTDRPVIRDVRRPIGSSGNVDVVRITQVLNKNTLYYGHARLIVDGVNGPFSATQSATMGNVLAPSPPTIETFNQIGRTDQARIQIKFNDDPSRGEKVGLSYRPANTTGDYIDLDSWERDNPPLDNLDDDPRIEAIRTIPLTGSVTLRAQCTNQSGASDAPTRNETFQT